MAAPSSQNLIISWSTFLLVFSAVAAWDNEDFELFDVVEEVNENFYDFLGVDQAASTSEIRKAYRKLTLQLHPDKNDAKDAETKFRHLVAVYEVLKDSDKRKRYNDVLVNGLPNWRQPIFYYRRARKMGILEMSVILFIVLTIGQFLVKWAIYFEKRLAVDEFISEQIEKNKKKSRKKREDDSELNKMYRANMVETIPRPRWQDLIPFALVKWFAASARNLPQTWRRVKASIDEYRHQKTAAEIAATAANEENENENSNEEESEEQIRPRRKRVVVEPQPEFIYAEASNILKPVQYAAVIQSDNTTNAENDDDRKKAGEWSTEEYATLSRAVNKFPGGTSNRWVKIAEFMGRPVSEVIKKAKGLQNFGEVSVDPSVQGLVCSEEDVASKPKAVSDEIMSTRLVDKNSPSPPAELRGNTGEIENNLNARKVAIKNSSNKKSADFETSSNSTRNSEKENSAASVITTQTGAKTWTQAQQKTLEWALAKHPKGTTDRWDKIAECITGKTKEDCIERFKYLAEMVKKRKATVANTKEKS
ncbi:dnaJ homolog subfamily C member 1-like [Tubulanus polymorphus]|uniref:dnaJ homolog subfamily C member 1-like n=1 Tax=Tubulanus polymorphus TaxID=672921 RepID=UPI003DA32E39